MHDMHMRCVVGCWEDTKWTPAYISTICGDTWGLPALNFKDTFKIHADLMLIAPCLPQVVQTASAKAVCPWASNLIQRLHGFEKVRASGNWHESMHVLFYLSISFKFLTPTTMTLPSCRKQLKWRMRSSACATKWQPPWCTQNICSVLHGSLPGSSQV